MKVMLVTTSMTKTLTLLILFHLSIIGNSLAEPLHCEQYLDDLHIINSLPFGVQILNDIFDSCSGSACATINSQGQIVQFGSYGVFMAFQIFCLIHLNKLDIAGSREIWQIPIEIGGLTNLKSLNLREIDGPVIPDTFGQLKQLEYLDLRGYNISELPETLGALTNLKSVALELPLNKLPLSLSLLPLNSLFLPPPASFTSLPDKFFRNLDPTLRSLYMTISDLASLDQFVDLTLLTSFTIFVDNLAVFPWQFTYLTGLRQLSFQGRNQLSSLPQNFSKTLIDVSLSVNFFSEIPPPLLLSKSLTNLDLSNNQISDIRPILSGRIPLKSLDFSNNQIEQVPREIRYLSDTLDTLLLARNQLTTLPAEELVKMYKINYISAFGNNFNSTELKRLKSIFATNPNIWFDV